MGMKIKGSYPPDIVCRMALNQENKIVISLYHDQGLIAFKLISFNNGVNMTLGLPFIRTSPDHGTAFDIAGKGKADPSSMLEAIRLACKFSNDSRKK
jgi:4-hydroxythreonine-4-phosphate dehydrogenase